MPPVPPDEPTAGEPPVVPAAPSDVLLGRYLDGGCSAVERRVVEAWAAADPSHGAMLEALRLAWFDGLTGRDARIATWRATWDADRAWQQLLAVRDGSQREGAERTPRRAVDPRAAASEGSGFPRPWPRGVGGGAGAWIKAPAFLFAGGAVAATAAMLLVAGVHSARTSGGERDRHEYVTAAGQRESITLRDGTQFTLAPTSRLRVPVTYGSRGRDVELEGEALFRVAHDARHPFAVHTTGATVRDLGTRFAVRAYPGEPARVVVAEGSVTVGAANAEPLRAGDLAVDTRKGVVVTRGIDITAYTDFANGRLTFRGTALHDVARELARWYDLDVTLDSSLADRQLTASFQDEPVSHVLPVLAASMNVRCEQEGHTLRIVPRVPLSTAPQNSNPILP